MFLLPTWDWRRARRQDLDFARRRLDQYRDR